jgi:hypothetical protein
MHAFCVKELGFSDASAYRRLQAVNLSIELPKAGIAERIESGDLSLTKAAKLNTFLRREEKEQGNKISKDQKTKLLSQVESTPDIEVDRLLASQRTGPTLKVRERARRVSVSETEIVMSADEELMMLFKEVGLLYSHQIPDMNRTKLVKVALRKLAERKRGRSSTSKVEKKEPNGSQTQRAVSSGRIAGEPERRLKRRDSELEPHSTQSDSKPKRASPLGAEKPDQPIVSSGRSAVQSMEQRRFALVEPKVRSGRQQKKAESKPIEVESPSSRYNPPALAREVLERQGDGCTFEGPDGRTCGSKYRLQIHHVKRYADGGGHTLDNLEPRCQAHNLFEESRLVKSEA